MTTPMQSNCCNADITIGGDETGEGATLFWVCEKCSEACRPAGDNPNLNIIKYPLTGFLEKTKGWVGTPLDPEDHWEYQGTTETYNSFWKTVISSPQWQAWAKKNREELLWDTTECEENGWISEEHFQEFLQFVIRDFLVSAIKDIHRD